MILALLKKQALSYAAFFLQGKDGKRRDEKGILGYALLMIALVASMGFIFYEMGDMLCAPLLAQGLPWLYFAFMGTVATALGIIFSIFTAKSALYEAKDNDLLFSMPIPSWMVLFCRMVGLYALTLLFEALVFIPAVIAYFVAAGFSFIPLLCSVIVMLIMPFGGLAICSILGWLLALVAAKLPWKNFFTLLFSVGFFIAYFILYSKMNEYLGYVIVYGGTIAAKMKTLLFPFWKLGVACTGGWGALGVYAALFLGVFALVYLLLSVTYLRFVTANRGGRKAKYKGKEGKQGAAFFALLKKEAMRFTKNPMLAMNSLLGTVFLLILPFGALFLEELNEVLRAGGMEEIIVLVLCIILCATISMNMISAASVSLEGENLWVVRSMPVETEKVLFAKATFHFATTAIPALFAGVFLGIFYKIGVIYTLLTLLIGVVFSALTALLGLLINLKMPNLHWTNELTAVKQSFSTMLSMFADWGALLLLVGGYFLFGKYMLSGWYLLVCIAFLLAINGLLCVWLCLRGKKIFESL